MNKKILVVDDEQSIRDSLNKALRAEGYEITLAEDGQTAIEKLTQEPVDLLLLDIGLPTKDGWDILKWLAKTKPMLPVVMITGRWKQDQLAQAAGVDVLMEKPLDVPLLFQIIHELTEEPAGARAARIRERGHDFRRAFCDPKEFCAQLQKRFMAPLSPNLEQKISSNGNGAKN